MQFLCKGFTPLQRRSIRRLSAVLFLTIAANFLVTGGSNPLFHLFPPLGRSLAKTPPSASLAVVLSVVALLPIVLAVWVASSYLKAEPDEFVRMLLVRALLWGFAATMAGDAVLGVLTMLYAHPFPISILNADLFIATTGTAFRLLRRSYE
jgi:hypothetical protein